MDLKSAYLPLINVEPQEDCHRKYHKRVSSEEYPSSFEVKGLCVRLFAKVERYSSAGMEASHHLTCAASTRLLT